MAVSSVVDEVEEVVAWLEGLVLRGSDGGLIVESNGCPGKVTREREKNVKCYEEAHPLHVRYCVCFRFA